MDVPEMIGKWILNTHQEPIPPTGENGLEG
jgi:hypothetical protein